MKNGFYFVISLIGEVIGMNDESCLYGNEIFLFICLVFCNFDCVNFNVVFSYEFYFVG